MLCTDIFNSLVSLLRKRGVIMIYKNCLDVFCFDETFNRFITFTRENIKSGPQLLQTFIYFTKTLNHKFKGVS